MVQVAAHALNRCEKLNLLSIGYNADLSPSAMRLYHRFVDQPDSCFWSSERLAASIRRCIRTVERALAELRTAGVLKTVRRRRRTMIKALVPEKIIDLSREGTAAAKRACAAVVALLRRGKSLTRQDRRPISILDIKKVDESTPWRVQGAPTPSLLRLMAQLDDPKRR